MRVFSLLPVLANASLYILWRKRCDAPTSREDRDASGLLQLCPWFLCPLPCAKAYSDYSLSRSRGLSIQPSGRRSAPASIGCNTPLDKECGSSRIGLFLEPAPP